MSTSTSALLLRIRRRLWVVLLCMALAAGAAALLARGPSTYSADAVLIVPGGGSSDDPGHASEAQRLAATYASVLGRDDGVSPAVAEALRRDRSEVEEHLVLQNVSGTSVIQVTYTASTPEEALQAVQTVVRLVTGTRPRTPTVAPGTLQATRVATQAQEQSRPPVVPIGLVLGLALGLLLAVTLDRADVRVEEGSDLDDLLPVPVSVLSGSPAALAEISTRWSERSEVTETVSLVPVLDSDHAAAAAVHARLVQHGHAAGVPLHGGDAAGQLDAAQRRVVVEHGSLAGEMRGEVLSASYTTAVLVVTQGTPVRRVRAALPALAALDVRLLWCLVVPVSVGRPRASGLPSISLPTLARKLPLPKAPPAVPVRRRSAGERDVPLRAGSADRD